MVALVVVVTGCSAEPEPVESSLSWEQAKAMAQAMELRIARLVPADAVLSIDQNEKGGFFSSDETRHRWKGITNVVLVRGTNVEAVTKQLEKQFLEEGDFDVTNHRGITDKYVVTLKSEGKGEDYLFGEGAPGTILIDSWSECFTLPEGTYPGGDF
ncbi:hypothetical protein KZC51_04480 [Microbacterium sp. SSW1-49]|uniref:Lipoprotein n=1 Tax=Microbacterium croceum TaxID=2851645 RepID=A0ABT0FCE5_9MICO|nr:hypothetical protein [Microbacterium croceum]MCK2035387.1 hypothetical protein [Microbacterium croceum]